MNGVTSHTRNQVVNLVTSDDMHSAITSAASQPSGSGALTALAPPQLTEAMLTSIRRENKRKDRQRRKLKEKAARKSAPGINTFAMETPSTDVVELFPGN